MRAKRTNATLLKVLELIHDSETQRTLCVLAADTERWPDCAEAASKAAALYLQIEQLARGVTH